MLLVCIITDHDYDMEQDMDSTPEPSQVLNVVSYYGIMYNNKGATKGPSDQSVYIVP